MPHAARPTEESPDPRVPQAEARGEARKLPGVPEPQALEPREPRVPHAEPVPPDQARAGLQEPAPDWPQPAEAAGVEELRAVGEPRAEGAVEPSA